MEELILEPSTGYLCFFHFKHYAGWSRMGWLREGGGTKSTSLTIIPRARMGYESIAHEAEGRMGY